MQETVLVLCAHSDDQVLGPGATMAKYSREGKKIVTVIFSYGEMTHPHLKEDVIKKMRYDESKKADDIIGGQYLTFFDLKEGKFPKDAKEKGAHKKLEAIIKKHKPTKIFTHSCDDPHPDHRAVYTITLETAKNIQYIGNIFSFDVWNPFNMRKRNNPKLYVDVSKTFSTKVKALQCFKSQTIAMTVLTWTIYLRAIVHGCIHKTKYAERFYLVW